MYAMLAGPLGRIAKLLGDRLPAGGTATQATLASVLSELQALNATATTIKNDLATVKADIATIKANAANIKANAGGTGLIATAA